MVNGLHLVLSSTFTVTQSALQWPLIYPCTRTYVHQWCQWVVIIHNVIICMPIDLFCVNICSFQTWTFQDRRPSTDFIPSAPAGCTDFGGPPPGSAVSLQGLWICWLDCSGFWVCPLQRTCLLLLTRAQTQLERQEPDHTPVPAVWGRQAARTQDTAPAMLCCSSGWGSARGLMRWFAV